MLSGIQRIDRVKENMIGRFRQWKDNMALHYFSYIKQKSVMFGRSIAVRPNCCLNFLMYNITTLKKEVEKGTYLR